MGNIIAVMTELQRSSLCFYLINSFYKLQCIILCQFKKKICFFIQLYFYFTLFLKIITIIIILTNFSVHYFYLKTKHLSCPKILLHPPSSRQARDSSRYYAWLVEEVTSFYLFLIQLYIVLRKSAIKKCCVIGTQNCGKEKTFSAETSCLFIKWKRQYIRYLFLILF